MSQPSFLLVGVDVQNDFILPNGRLSVKPGGCLDDTQRTARMIERYAAKIAAMLFTLDTHDKYQIFHQLYWVDASGKPPPWFTEITAAMVRQGKYTPFNSVDKDVALANLDKLEAKGNFKLRIWPDHCLAGTEGAALHNDVAGALDGWVTKTSRPGAMRKINLLTKGTYTHSEHYGALEAEVPDPKVPATTVNMAYIKAIQPFDHIGVVGQASSHCVRSTIAQLVYYLGDEVLPKLCIFTDAMSPVVTPAYDYGPETAAWLKSMEAKGAKLVKTDTFFH